MKKPSRFFVNFSIAWFSAMTVGPCRSVRPRRHVWGQFPYCPGWLAFILVACLVCSPAHADDNPPPGAELEAKFTCSLQPVWDDRRSGANLDGFFYLPNVGPTEYIVGGYGNRNKTLLASDCVLTLRDPAYLAAPVGWQLIWKDTGSGARLDGSMWRPIPPSGDYRCLGHVPQEGYDEPYIPNYRCVHASFTEKLVTDEVIWSDKGSRANKQVTMLRLPNTYSFVAIGARVGQLEAYDLRVDHSAPAGNLVVVQADRSDSSANQVADTESADEESKGATIPESTDMEAEAGRPLKTGNVETQTDADDDKAARLRAVAEAALAAEDFDLATDYLARLRALRSDAPEVAEEQRNPATTRQEQADDQTPEPGEQRVVHADTSDSPSVDEAIEDHPKASEADDEVSFTTDELEASNKSSAQTIMDDSEMNNEKFVQAERIETESQAARLMSAEKSELAAEDIGLTTDYLARQRALRSDSPTVAEGEQSPVATRQEQADDQIPEPGEQRVVHADTSDSPSVDEAIEGHPKASEADDEVSFTTDELEASNKSSAQTIMDDSEMNNEKFVQAERIETESEAARLRAIDKSELAAEDIGLTTDYLARQRALRSDSPEVAEEQRSPAATRQEQTDGHAPEPGEQRVVQADTGNIKFGDETPVQTERIETEIEPSNTNETASQTDNNVLEAFDGTNDSPLANLVPEIDIKISETVYILIFLFTAAAFGYFLPGMKKKLWLLIAVLLLILIYFGIKSYASHIAEKEIDKAIDKVSEFVNVNYKSVSVDLFGMDVRISDIFVTPSFDTKQNIVIDEIIIRDIDDKSDIPAFMSISVHGVELKIDDFEQLSELEKLGYPDELFVDLGMDYVFANDELSVNDLFIKIDDLGELSVDFRLGNLSIQQPGIFKLLFMYPEILLYELQIELDVVPLVERYIESGAEEFNISKAEFKSKAIEAIEQDIKNAGNTDHFFYISYLVLKKNYIDKPDELSISMSPKSSYQQLGQIQNLSLEELDYINLRVE